MSSMASGAVLIFSGVGLHRARLTEERRFRRTGGITDGKSWHINVPKAT